MTQALAPTNKLRILWPFVAAVLLVLEAVLVSFSSQREHRLVWNSVALFVVLMLATWGSVKNALTSKHSIRLFWLFLAIGSGLWALNALLAVLYAAGRLSNFPNPMPSASVLFLHTVMMLAALASRPHVKQLEHRLSRTALNCLLLLFFWLFTYVFFLIPEKFPDWDATTIQWFSILYFIENLILTVAAAILALRVADPWKSVYSLLFAAAALYTAGSLVLNLRVAHSTHFPGLLETLSTGAACILVWATIRGKELAPWLAQSAQLERVGYSGMEISAILPLAAIPVIGVLEILRESGPGGVPTIRLIAIAAVVLVLTLTAFLREYVVHREFALDIDLARAQLHLAMQSGKSIGWDLNVSTGEGLWFGDLETFFGIRTATCIAPAEDFYRYVHPLDQPKVSEALSHAIQTAEPFAAVFRLILPNNTTTWVTSRGRFYYKANGEPTRMLGVAVDINEQKQSEAALREHEDKLRLVLESAAEGIYGVDLEGHCTFCNPAALSVLGYRRVQDLMGRKMHDLIHHSHQDRRPYSISECPILAVLHNGKRFHSDQDVFWRADGTFFPVEYWSYPQRKGPEVVGAVVTFFDITERWRAEAVLRESESRFRNMANRAPVLLWMSGKDGLCDYFNQRWLNFTGRPLEAELGNGWVEGVHPEDRERCMKIYTESFAARQPFSMEYRLRRYDGEHRWILDNGVPRFSFSDEFEGYIGSAIDVTEVRHAEEVLQKSEEEFSLAFEAARLGWWVWSEKNQRATWSEGTKAVLGWRYESEVTLDTFLNMLHPEDRERVYRTWRRSVENQTHYFVEYRVLWPDGTVHWVEARGRTYSDSRDKSVQMIGVLMDITERKRAEEALRSLGGRLLEAQEQERMRIARELHDDICQRLALLGIELVRLKDHPELAEAELQKWANRQAQFTAEIASDLQALSHELHSSKLDILGTTAAMKSFCGEFAEKHHVEVEFTSNNVPFSLSRDVSVCLYRILQEALHNAVKHSGTYHFSVELRGEPDCVELKVSDFGIGFDPEKAVQGYGLGVVSMRERVKLVKGTIAIESQPMQGTTIKVRVPVDEVNALRYA